MSLDDFAKSCAVEELAKTVYPYEKWYGPEEIVQCSSFPPFADFKSSLSKKENSELLREFEDVANSRLKSAEWKTKR